MKLYTILMQKTKSASVLKNTEADYGVVCIDFEMPDIETKELPNNEWLDEDGDDVYIPNKLCEKGTQLLIKAGFKGKVSEWESKMDSFVDYLTGHDGSGAEVMIYLPFHKIGRVCRLKKIPKPTPSVSNEEVILEFDLELAIDNPRDRINLGVDLHNNITSLNRQKR